ncbi:hypothetical protein ACS0TY_026423 [Phlomoides rotata]
MYRRVERDHSSFSETGKEAIHDRDDSSDDVEATFPIATCTEDYTTSTIRGSHVDLKLLTASPLPDRSCNQQEADDCIPTSSKNQHDMGTETLPEDHTKLSVVMDHSML